MRLNHRPENPRPESKKKVKRKIAAALAELEDSKGQTQAKRITQLEKTVAGILTFLEEGL